MTIASTVSASPMRTVSRLAALRMPPTVALAFVVIALVIAWSLVPNLFTSHDPTIGVPADKLLGPSAKHWFGTDQLGRDLYTRVVYGTASSVTSALIAVVIGVVVGGLIGLLAGFLGGWVDIVLARWSMSCWRSRTSCWPSSSSPRSASTPPMLPSRPASRRWPSSPV
jgi:peptide/nickel transport system permease protein